MVLIVNKQLLFECVRLLVVLHFAENIFCKLYKYMINSKNLIPLNLIVLGFPKIVQVQKFQEWILHHLQLYYYSLCISILFWVKHIQKFVLVNNSKPIRTNLYAYFLTIDRGLKSYFYLHLQQDHQHVCFFLAISRM